MAALKSSRRWKWSEGFRKPARLAQALGRELEILRSQNRGRPITARQVVERARPAGSPIHGLFTWDQRKAADLWRANEAREYMRHCVFIVTLPGGEPQEVPVTVSYGPGKGYLSGEDVLENPVTRERYLAQALNEADNWRARYRWIKELTEVFEALDRVKK